MELQNNDVIIREGNVYDNHGCKMGIVEQVETHLPSPPSYTYLNGQRILLHVGGEKRMTVTMIMKSFVDDYGVITRPPRTSTQPQTQPIDLETRAIKV